MYVCMYVCIDRSSISVRVIPRTQKWYVVPPSMIRKELRAKWSNPTK